MKKEFIERIGATKFARKRFLKKKVQQYQTEKEKFDVVLPEMKKQCNGSIHTCSIFTWWQIRETGDLTFLLKEKREVDKEEDKCLRVIYAQMLKEYSLAIPPTEEEIRLMDLYNEALEAIKIRILDKDDTQWTVIDIVKSQIEALTTKNDGEKPDLFQYKTILQKIIGTPINVYKCSVVEFYGYIKFAESQNTRTDG